MNRRLVADIHSPFGEVALSLGPRLIVAGGYMTNYSIKKRIRQGTGAVLRDKKTDWRCKKLQGLAVSEVHHSLKKSALIAECGSSLLFAESSSGERRLAGATFCRERLCPMCQQRRSLVIFHQVRRVCTELERQRSNVAFIMLTLTQPSIPGELLKDEITRLTDAFKKLFKRKEVKAATLGYFRSLEVTHNQTRNDYHPHFHVLIAVNSSYFTSRNYIPRDRWLSLWQEATGQPEITQVDVRRIKAREHINKETGEVTLNPVASAAAEVGKYATKPADYIVKKGRDFYQANGSVVNLLAYALKGKRLIGWGGELDKIRKALELDNAEGSRVDLVETGGESEQIKAVSWYLYRWVPGLRNYVN